MKISELTELLRTHGEKQFHLVLPDSSAVPVSFHITEVAYVQKRFIDCGGRKHTLETCQLQAWLGPDTDHRLEAGKMASIFTLAGDIFPAGVDLDVEVEYEDTVISQYPVGSYTVTDSAVVLNLTTKHTDCLARGICLPTLPLSDTAACCGSGCAC